MGPWVPTRPARRSERRAPNRVETIFEAGSVSKQVTAASIHLLAARGQLALTDDIRRYFPELPDYGTPITITDLLQHTSGLRDWGAIAELEGWPRGTRTINHGHVLAILARQHGLNHPVDAKYSYTNSGYSLLAMLVERISGTPLAEFMKLTRIPIVIYYGDFIPKDPVANPGQDGWRARLAMARQWADAINRHGGDAKLIHLPEIGIHGNTHFPFSDLNNVQIADLMSKFLAEKHLD